MASIGRCGARRINEYLARRGPLWQDGLYEHIVRDRKDYDDVLSDVHDNAVEARLVSSADVGEYSTANERYAGEIDWEWLGLPLPNISKSKHRFGKERIPPTYR